MEEKHWEQLKKEHQLSALNNNNKKKDSNSSPKKKSKLKNSVANNNSNINQRSTEESANRTLESLALQVHFLLITSYPSFHPSIYISIFLSRSILIISYQILSHQSIQLDEIKPSLKSMSAFAQSASDYCDSMVTHISKEAFKNYRDNNEDIRSDPKKLIRSLAFS